MLATDRCKFETYSIFGLVDIKLVFLESDNDNDGVLVVRLLKSVQGWMSLRFKWVEGLYQCHHCTATDLSIGKNFGVRQDTRLPQLIYR